MADVEKKALLEVDIKAAGALKNLAELKIELNNLQNERKNLAKAMNDKDLSVEQYAGLRTAYEEVGQEIKALTFRTISLRLIFFTKLTIFYKNSNDFI